MIEQSTTYDKCRSCLTFNIKNAFYSLNFFDNTLVILKNSIEYRAKFKKIIQHVVVDVGCFWICGMIFLA